MQTTLDYIFQNRNRAYGAYDLRKRYPRHILIGFLFTFGVALLFGIWTILQSSVDKGKSSGVKMVEVKLDVRPLKGFKVETAEGDKRSQEKSGEVKRGQEKSREVKRSQESREGKRRQEKAGEVRRRQEKAGEGRSSQVENTPLVNPNITQEQTTPENPEQPTTPNPSHSVPKDSLQNLAPTPQPQDSMATLIDSLLQPVQNFDPDDGIVNLEEGDFQPVLLGGLDSLLAQVNYPGMARRANIQGDVVIEFELDVRGNVVIEKDENGEIINPKFIKKIGVGCDEEAMRHVKRLKFEPAKRANGKAVRVKQQITIPFRL